MIAYLVAGLGFGDEGKGSTVDTLCRWTGAKWVVRYNGGPQCGHNVVTDDGRHHVFSQFTSGSFIPGVHSYLSRFMLIEPYALFNEAEVLGQILGENPINHVTVEEGCPIITPFHWLTNRAKEVARSDRHGSCGFGVGELRSDETEGRSVLKVRDLANRTKVHQYLSALKQDRHIVVERLFKQTGKSSVLKYLQAIITEDIGAIIAKYDQFVNTVAIVPDDSLCHIKGPVVFEGAQGMLLDENHGFPPYYTWTDISFNNAYKLIPYNAADIFKIGVLRTYHTRHGAGPFPTEDPTMKFPDHNCTNDWQGNFRFGNFDLLLAKYALKCIGGVDALALNHLDQVPIINCVDTYKVDGQTVREINGPDTDLLAKAVAGPVTQIDPMELFLLLGTPILVKSYGVAAKNKLNLAAVAK